MQYCFLISLLFPFSMFFMDLAIYTNGKLSYLETLAIIDMTILIISLLFVIIYRILVTEKEETLVSVILMSLIFNIIYVPYRLFYHNNLIQDKEVSSWILALSDFSITYVTSIVIITLFHFIIIGNVSYLTVLLVSSSVVCVLICFVFIKNIIKNEEYMYLLLFIINPVVFIVVYYYIKYRQIVYDYSLRKVM